VFDMHGGLSQVESWDPKPATATGGPFRAIPTSAPGFHISELLPQAAQQMHYLCLVRSVYVASCQIRHAAVYGTTSAGRHLGRIFFGRDMQRAQCHDHPLIADYLQSDYHDVSVFGFGRHEI
jgi:hypothetical protein